MLSKEQAQHDGKRATVRPKLPVRAAEDFEILSLPQAHPASIIRRAGIDPSSLIATDVDQLQRTIGNRAVCRLLPQTGQRGPAQANSQAIGTDPAQGLIQRTRIQVPAGEFSDETRDTEGKGYETYTETKTTMGRTWVTRGARMGGLSFIPKQDLRNASGALATEVSLVQTTNSQIHDVQDPNPVDQPESLLEERRTAAGSAIDQQIYPSQTEAAGGQARWKSQELAAALQSIPLTNVLGQHPSRKTWKEILEGRIAEFTTGAFSTNGPVRAQKTNQVTIVRDQLKKCLAAQTHAGVRWGIAQAISLLETMLQEQEANQKEEKFHQAKLNLDPRYAQERERTSEPFKPKPAELKQTHGWAALRPNGSAEWNPREALLRDNPSRKFENTHTVGGHETFEVTAMADGNRFVGSVGWGWDIDYRYNNGAPVDNLSVRPLALINAGSASADFYEAAQKWNRMRVKDPNKLREGLEHSPMQLPTREPEME